MSLLVWHPDNTQISKLGIAPLLMPSTESKKEKLYFDLAIIDADHSKNAVFNDVTGILPHSEVILMHDSFNPECRKGMLEH